MSESTARPSIAIPPSGSRKFRRTLFLGLLAAVTAILALTALMIPLLERLMSPLPAAGEVAGQDFRAAEAITFESETLTNQKRDLAERSVLPVYSPADTGVARKQLEGLRAALAFIASVRADTHATVDQKMKDLSALEDVRLTQEMMSYILGLNDSRWQSVQQEAIVVLEQVMRSPIRQETLEEARGRLPNLVSLALPESQAGLVVQLATPFITPNSLLDEALTTKARNNARNAVEPVSRTFAVGQTVVLRGQVLSEADLEALQKLDLIRAENDWQEPAGAVALVVLTLVFIAYYLRRAPALTESPRSLMFVNTLMLVFLFGMRLIVPGHAIIPYAFPLAAYGMTVSALFGMEAALITSLSLALMSAYGLSNELDLTIFLMMSSLVGILALGRAQRVMSFFWAGLATAFSGIAVVLAYRMALPSSDWVGIATLSGAAIFNGLASASLTIVLQYFLAQFLGLTTPMQLMELTRPDHPLLQKLLREAPGTYQHSLQVANLAEQAAEKIDANPLLTRVGALYHDAGKALNPAFFIENQAPGFPNPHDSMAPDESAAIILRHVSDGLELAHKYHLPRRMQAFIAEHHGTMLARYQYVKAVEAAGGQESLVDKENFRYPGPRPQSKETAILMLADGCEARVRAEHPTGEEELLRVIKSVIEQRVNTEQLDDTQLTLRDLDEIARSFSATLRGLYHPRVRYPNLESVISREAQVPELNPPTVPRPQVGLPSGSSADSQTSPTS